MMPMGTPAQGTADRATKLTRTVVDGYRVDPRLEGGREDGGQSHRSTSHLATGRGSSGAFADPRASVPSVSRSSTQRSTSHTHWPSRGRPIQMAHSASSWSATPATGWVSGFQRPVARTPSEAVV